MDDYAPVKDGFVTIDLPGERTRARVESVVSETAIIVQLVTFTTSREHRYKRGDYVPCSMEMDGFNQRCWIAMNETGLREKALERKDPEREVVEDPKPVFQPVEPVDSSFVLSEN